MRLTLLSAALVGLSMVAASSARAGDVRSLKNGIRLQGGDSSSGSGSGNGAPSSGPAAPSCPAFANLTLPLLPLTGPLEQSSITGSSSTVSTPCACPWDISSGPASAASYKCSSKTVTATTVTTTIVISPAPACVSAPACPTAPLPQLTPAPSTAAPTTQAATTAAPTTAAPTTTVAPTSAAATTASSSWSFAGCYTYSNTTFTTLVNKDNNQTPESCQSACQAQSYQYSALMAGNQCWGGNVSLETCEVATDCTMTCAGDSSQSCGGSTSVSVWQSGSH